MSRYQDRIGWRELVLLATSWLVALAAVDLSLVDAVALLGIAVVLPLALGGRAWWWAAALAGACGSFARPTGWAAVLVAPFVLAACAVLVGVVRRAGAVHSWRIADLALVVGAADALVAALALAQSRAGVEVLGTHEPFIELTCVHFTFAGTAALVLARQTLGSRAGLAAVVLTGAAPPLVAVGFVTGAAAPQVGGAMILTIGVWTTASLQLGRAVRARQDLPGAVLLFVSGVAVWVPMVLAVAWAAGQHWAIPVLSIPDMARTHGLVNAFAFVLCGLLARRLLPRAVTS
jgi:hypothetical protein